MINNAVAVEGRRAEPLATEAIAQSALRPGPKPGRRRRSWAWLGVVPFFAYACMFLIFPAAVVMIGAFKSDHGGYTTSNVLAILRTANLRDAFWASIKLSADHRVLRRRCSGS